MKIYVIKRIDINSTTEVSYWTNPNNCRVAAEKLVKRANSSVKRINKTREINMGKYATLMQELTETHDNFWEARHLAISINELETED